MSRHALGQGTLSKHVMERGRGTVSRQALGRSTMSWQALGRRTLSRYVMALSRDNVSKNGTGLRHLVEACNGTRSRHRV